MVRRFVFLSLVGFAAGVVGCQSIAGIEEKTLGDAGPVDTEPLRIGMPTVLQGVSAELGIQMKRGVDAWFKHVNEKGHGIKGSRPIVLVPVNDNYEPAGATAAIKQLLDIQGDMLPNLCATASAPPDCVLDRPDVTGPNKVLSILGQVGTPTMVVTAPVCIRNKVIYFGPFTGAQKFLRDSSTIASSVFNFRAGYYEETAAFVDYFFRTLGGPLSPAVTDYTRIIAFTQNDAFGDSGYAGFRLGYSTKIKPIGDDDIKRINYERNNLASVDDSVAKTIAYLDPMVKAVKDAPGNNQRFSVGIFMIPSYAPAAKYIKDVKTWVNADDDRARLLNVVFMNVSFVGADALLKDLTVSGSYTERGSGAKKYFGDGVWVTQVVPYYRASLPGVVQYREDIQAADQGASTWGSLEGYVAARLFTEGLDRTTAYDTDSMIKAYESIKDYDLGIGAKVGFDNALPEGHQASHTVFLSRIKLDDATPSGEFEVPYLWTGPVRQPTQISAP